MGAVGRRRGHGSRRRNRLVLAGIGALGRPPAWRVPNPLERFGAVSLPLPAVALAAAIAGLWIGHSAAFSGYVTDDAFISFRYLENLATGHGLVYNPGEHVWGFTNFLWMMLLLPGTLLGVDPLWMAHGLGWAFNAGCLLLVAFGFPSLHAGSARWNAGGAALLASNGAFLLQAWNGLETSLFSFLALCALLLYRRALTQPSSGRLLACGVAAALATLARPEGVLVIAALAWSVAADSDATLPPRRRLLPLLAGFAPPVAAFELAMFAYYGTPWPNSIDAKVGLSVEQIVRGLHYVGVFAVHNAPHVLVIAAALLLWKRSDPVERCALRLAALLVLFTSLCGADWMLGYRFCHTLIALSCVVVPLVLGAIRAAAGRPTPLLQALAVTVLCALNLANSFVDHRVTDATRESYVHYGTRIGKWMHTHLPPDAVVATNTAGTIGYYSKLRIVDMMGINDRTIARREDLPADWRGIETGDGRYVLARRPDYIQFGTSWGSQLPIHLSDIEIFQSEEFHRSYELVDFDVDARTGVRLYRRRQVPRRHPPTPAQWALIERIADERLQDSAFRY